MALGFSAVGESELDRPEFGYTDPTHRRSDRLWDINNHKVNRLLNNILNMEKWGHKKGSPLYGELITGRYTNPYDDYVAPPVDITGKPPGMREPFGRNYYGPLYDPIDHATTAYSPPSPVTAGRSYWDYDEPQGGGELLPWEALAKQMQGDYWMGGYGYNPLPKRRSLPYMDAFTNAFVTWPKGEGPEFQRRMWESDA